VVPVGKLIPLLIKELKLISRRPAVLFLLLFLPVFFGLVFSSYTSAIPRETPVAIVIDEKLPPSTVKEIMTIASTFSHPYLVSDLPRALDGLQRENYYVVIEIKHYESFTNASYVVYYDDSMTPVASVSSDLLELLRVRLGGTDIEEHPVNEHASLPEFFFPGVLLVLAMIVGFEVVSDNTLEERAAFPRLRVSSSLSLNFTVRIVVAIIIMLLQAVLTELIYVSTGTNVRFSWGAVVVLVLSTLYLALIGLGTVFLFRFQRHAKSFLQMLAGFLVFISGFFYPVGFFPPSLQRLALLTPTYYSSVMLRAFMYRDVSMGLFSDYMEIIALTSMFLVIVDFALYRRIREWRSY
jgi:ABC-2 type transport system permease protein